MPIVDTLVLFKCPTLLINLYFLTLTSHVCCCCIKLLPLYITEPEVGFAHACRLLCYNLLLQLGKIQPDIDSAHAHRSSERVHWRAADDIAFVWYYDLSDTFELVSFQVLRDFFF